MAGWYADIVRTRVGVQRLAGSGFRQPSDVVGWLVAVQSQDYAGAKWALGLRGTGFTDSDVDRAFNHGAILRTHVMRPTWHFVAAADLRWLLTLTAPRVHAANGFPYRMHALDTRTLSRSRTVLERVLGGGRSLTRKAIGLELSRAGIQASGQRLAYVMMHAELERVVCSGPLAGRQFTYALFDERVPRAPARDKDELLAELTRRYFTGHGPATLRDYSWWSGLTMREVKRGVDIVGRALDQRVRRGLAYWEPRETPPKLAGSDGTFLLPNYDECLIAYKDRGPVTAVSVRDPFPYHVLVNGALAGSWRRTSAKTRVLVHVASYATVKPRAAREIAASAERLAAFLGASVDVVTHTLPSAPVSH